MTPFIPSVRCYCGTIVRDIVLPRGGLPDREEDEEEHPFISCHLSLVEMQCQGIKWGGEKKSFIMSKFQVR